MSRTLDVLGRGRDRPRAAPLLAALLVAVWPVAVMAQQVFPAGVSLVAVDVTVVDRQGRPVVDLRPEDFAVHVGGRQRKVVAAQFLRQIAEVRESFEPARTEPAGQSAFSSNRDLRPGRLIVLVPDVGFMSTTGGRAAIEAAARFVDRLAPEDRVALVTVPLGPSVDFTTDRARVKEALEKVRGGSRQRVMGMRNISIGEAIAKLAPMGDQRIWVAAVKRECGGFLSGGGNYIGDCGLDLEMEARRILDDAYATTTMSVEALRSVLKALARIDGPKTVVFVSQGLITGRSGGDLGADRWMKVVGEEAAAARASFYTILVDRAFMEAGDPSERFLPETRFQEADLYRDGLEAIAGYAGGPLLKALTTADFAFERVASETSASWLLSFEPERDDRDGKPHSIRVTVGREGVEVRSRTHFVVAPPATGPPTAEARARRSLDALLPDADVPLAVTTLTLGDRAGDVRVIVAAEVGLEAGLARSASVGYRFLDAEGGVAAGAIETGRLDPVRSPGGAALYYLTTVTLKPGRYTLKVAAALPSGRAGSVERPVEARMVSAGGWLLSDLLVAETGRRASGLTIAVDGRLLGRTARALVEVAGEGAAPSVQFEVASPDEPGARLMAGASLGRTTDPSRYTAETTVDMGPLEPGRYELRAVVLREDGTEIGRAVRTVELLPAR